jgi:hypothetical protein
MDDGPLSVEIVLARALGRLKIAPVEAKLSWTFNLVDFSSSRGLGDRE